MVPLLIAAGMAALNYEQNKEKQKQEQQNMLANSEAMKYSPWTKMNPQMMGHNAQTGLAAAAQGGLAGYMQGQGMQQQDQTNQANMDYMKAKTNFYNNGGGQGSSP